VIGAGTMGSGIAQVCAQQGFYTILFDIDGSMLQRASDNIRQQLQILEAKKKITSAESVEIFERIRFVSDTNDCLADLIIEAIVEKPEAKLAIFNQLAEVNHADVIFASNTSSLSISALQASIPNPQRVVGMHFFNPATLMKLVEVVKGNQTSDEVADTIATLCTLLNKTPVMCKDAPGFIVNRVARHYYLEAMKLMETGVAGFEQIDEIMEATGFKMGPFRLMDLIGMDINLAVSQSLYKAFEHELRFTPSVIQVNKVARGELGKKTGKGFYQYAG
jgi:3-hydroxybutyryl-CoA dehydrogenase